MTNRQSFKQNENALPNRLTIVSCSIIANAETKSSPHVSILTNKSWGKSKGFNFNETDSKILFMKINLFIHVPSQKGEKRPTLFPDLCYKRVPNQSCNFRIVSNSKIKKSISRKRLAYATASNFSKAFWLASSISSIQWSDWLNFFGRVVVKNSLTILHSFTAFPPEHSRSNV